MRDKPIKESVAFCVVDGSGKFLAVKRSRDDKSIPNVWALPAASLRVGESNESAVHRAARDKLAVEVGYIRFIGDGIRDKGDYILHLSEYEVRITSGEPRPVAADLTVSNYVDIQWTDDPKLLLEAANRGSLCSSIFLKSRGLWSNG